MYILFCLDMDSLFFQILCSALVAPLSLSAVSIVFIWAVVRQTEVLGTCIDLTTSESACPVAGALDCDVPARVIQV